MNNMIPDAMRRAFDKMRTVRPLDPGRMADATALVESTLARHGLGTTGPMTGHAPDPAPSGGDSRRQRFTCSAGSRDYLLHLPDNKGKPLRGLVLMLHGCTQSPEDFAKGTAMNAQAEAAGLAVVYAAQSRGDNAQSCWNWFSGADQQRGRGEPAILAGLVRDVAARHGVPQGAIFVAGLSAGAAMAVILGRTYPELFAAVGAHSGLPYGCARGVTEAFAAMAGPGTVGRCPAADRPVPTIVFHGALDTTVTPANGLLIVADALAATGQTTEIVENGRTAGRGFRRTTSLGSQGNALAEHWQIEGLGHAWSGGDAKGSYADAQGPNASAEMIRFFLSLTV